MIGYTYSRAWWREQYERNKVMLSYTTPATIKRDNAEADRIMRKLGHSGVLHEPPAPVTAATKEHERLLQSRKQG